MPGFSMRWRVGLATVVAGLALGAVLLAGFGAVGAKAGPLQCSYRSVKPTETGKRIDAKGRMRCVGSSVRRQVLRVCLLQDTGSRNTSAKCVTHTLNGPGTVTATAPRLCPKGSPTAYISRIHIRVRLRSGSVQKASTDSSQAVFERDCVG